MKIRILWFALPAVAVLGLTFGSCKPTEAGYRDAYQRATANAKDKEREGLTDEEYALIQKENAPKFRKIGIDSVAYIHRALTPESSSEGENPVRNYNLAVGKFRMPTNARSFCSRLHEQGFASYIARDADSDCYVMAGGYDSDTEIPLLLSRFAASGLPCSGLDRPLLIITK